MKFLTLKQVKAAAKRGKISAARCSWKHHNQLATCTYEEFLKQFDIYNDVILGKFCALCHFARGKDGKCHCRNRCRLANNSECCKEWRDVWYKLFDLDEENIQEKFHAYQAAEAALRDYIASKYPELKK